VPDTVVSGGHGGTYPNLFDAHPPFQIDGNFGCTAGIAEMLVQSHDGFVNLLPALPDEWASGSVSGICCVGGFVIDDLRWEHGVVTYLRIRSTLGGNLRLSCSNQLTSKTHHLMKATGDNPNSFFATFTMPVTRVDGDSYTPADQMTTSLPSKFVWDVDTKKDEVVECLFNQ
jgi:alpha-L-fucosidase 2